MKMRRAARVSLVTAMFLALTLAVGAAPAFALQNGYELLACAMSGSSAMTSWGTASSLYWPSSVSLTGHPDPSSGHVNSIYVVNQALGDSVEVGWSWFLPAYPIGAPPQTKPQDFVHQRKNNADIIDKDVADNGSQVNVWVPFTLSNGSGDAWTAYINNQVAYSWTGTGFYNGYSMAGVERQYCDSTYQDTNTGSDRYFQLRQPGANTWYGISSAYSPWFREQAVRDHLDDPPYKIIFPYYGNANWVAFDVQ